MSDLLRLLQLRYLLLRLLCSYFIKGLARLKSIKHAGKPCILALSICFANCIFRFGATKVAYTQSQGEEGGRIDDHRAT